MAAVQIGPTSWKMHWLTEPHSLYRYPGDTKNKNGKLRLLYECAPMSMIAEQVRVDRSKDACGWHLPVALSCLCNRTDLDNRNLYMCANTCAAMEPRHRQCTVSKVYCMWSVL